MPAATVPIGAIAPTPLRPWLGSAILPRAYELVTPMVTPLNSAQVMLFNPLKTDALYSCACVILERIPALLLKLMLIPVMVRKESEYEVSMKALDLLQ